MCVYEEANLIIKKIEVVCGFAREGKYIKDALLLLKKLLLMKFWWLVDVVCVYVCGAFSCFLLLRLSPTPSPFLLSNFLLLLLSLSLVLFEFIIQQELNFDGTISHLERIT